MTNARWQEYFKFYKIVLDFYRWFLNIALMKTVKNTKNYIYFLALMTALASSLFLLEFFIPKPILFMKIGLSNIVVLLLVYVGLYREALIVALSKSVIGVFITGAIISPTFLLSLCGALTSCVAMIIVLKIQGESKVFTIFGLSIVGAFVHLLTQLCIVRILIIQSNSIFSLYPIIAILSVFTGILTGLASYYFIKYIDLRGFYAKTCT